MKNSKHYIDVINEKLLMKRTSDDISISLNIPEHKFKKHAEKLNWALRDTYNQYMSKGTKMFHLILAMQDYFDVTWLIETVLEQDIKKQVESEMSIEYGIKKTKPKKKKKVIINPDNLELSPIL